WRRVVQSTQSGNAPSVEAPSSRGDTNTETALGPLVRLNRGITVKRTVCSAAMSASRKRERVVLPGIRIGEEVDEMRIAASAKRPLDGQFDGGAEEEHVHGHGQRCAAVRLVARTVVGEAQIELDGNTDDAKHAHRSADTQKAAENRRQLGAAFFPLQRE